MFIVVRGKSTRMHEVAAYLYNGQSVVSEPQTGTYGTFVVVDAGTDAYRANYLAGRFQSGMFGATVFETLPEAYAYIAAELA